MNNACPGCGAVYAVTSRDIGRKLKCKKCSMALAVTDTGLVADSPGVVPATTTDYFGTGDSASVVLKKTRRYVTGGGLGELVDRIGGIPTLLFGFGLFLVIVFYFMPQISNASVSRAEGRKERIDLEREQKLRKERKDQEEIEQLTPQAQEEYFKALAKREKEIAREFKPKTDEASDDIRYAKIDQKRSIWWDRYGLMFGFVFLAFGCVGYIRGDQHLVVKIVGASILVAMMLFVFGSMGGCPRE